MIRKRAQGHATGRAGRLPSASGGTTTRGLTSDPGGVAVVPLENPESLLIGITGPTAGLPEGGAPVTSGLYRQASNKCVLPITPPTGREHAIGNATRRSSLDGAYRNPKRFKAKPREFAYYESVGASGSLCGKLSILHIRFDNSKAYVAIRSQSNGKPFEE